MTSKTLRALVLAAGATFVMTGCAASVPGPTSRPQSDERLTFQAQGPWQPRVNINADVAMVYGIDKTLPERLATWKDKGYTPQVMTGVAWGEYQDYFYGRWDGTPHTDEAQEEKGGRKIGHGGDVWYMSPGIQYGKYLSDGVKRAIDAGAEAIYLEEPEYWVRGGWSEGFKREWQAYYHEPWIEPDSSPDAQYRASKLKYYLYRRALAQVFQFAKEYGEKLGRKIPCYVPTHSLINYASWGIVSPESSLMDVGCDGYIAQVWTGTARTPNVYEGQTKERTFETAFLEYGVMQNLVRASGRRMWYLNDPIEDNPQHSWYDYRTNWESTLVASLLQPEIYRYEVMPWPHRIFNGKHPSTQPVRRDTPRIPMPKEYETELQAVITAMGDLKQPEGKVRWEAAGTHGTGVLVSDSMMFQRFGPSSSDAHLSSFYGLALPLLMKGLPVEPVQIETADLSKYKVLLLTYEGQKPPKPEFHEALAKWVREGGALVVVDDDKDPFHKVREWWNSDGRSFATPREHLFQTLGMSPDADGLTHVGRGTVTFSRKSPAALAHDRDGANVIRNLTRGAMGTAKMQWAESDALVLRRGPYVIAAGLQGCDRTLEGKYLALFDQDIPTVHGYKLGSGGRAVLVDVDASPSNRVIAAACRVRNEKSSWGTLSFDADGVENSPAVVCVKMDRMPKSVSLGGSPIEAGAMTFEDGVLRLRFTNRVDPLHVEIAR